MRIARRGTRGRRAEYRQYLKGPHWLARRKLALFAASYRCQACSSTVRLEVHHESYARLGAELPADLRVLCRACHGEVHGTKRRRRRRAGGVIAN